MNIKLRFSDVHSDCLEIVGLCGLVLIDRFHDEANTYRGCIIDKASLCVGCLTGSMEKLHASIHKTK